MKKFFATVLSATMAISLAACGGSSKPAATTAAPATTAAAAETTAAETKAEETEAPATEATAAEAEYTISVSLTTADDSACNKMIYYMGDLVKEKTNGRVVFEVFPNGTMANDTGSVEGVQMGTIGMTLVSSANYATFDKNQSVFDLPFLFPTKDDAYAFFDSDLAKQLASGLDEYGIHCFGYMDYGYRLLTNNVKEITSLDDLKGLKIRTMNSPYQVKTWESLGTVPTIISFSELFTALQQNTVDGQENPWGNIISQKFYEVQKYATDTHHILTVCPLVMSRDVYESLPEDLRAIVDECAAEALVKGRELVNIEDEQGAKTASDAGMTVSPISEEEIAKMREACQPVYDMMLEDVGDIVTEVQDFFK